MATYYLDPDGESYTDLVLSNPAIITVSSTLSKVTRSPTTPSLTPYADISSASGSAVLDFEGFNKTPITTIVSVTLNVYRTIESSSTVEFKILVGSTEVATQTDSTPGTDWSSLTWASGDISQQDIHDLRARVNLTKSGTAPKVYGMYFEVSTTETSMTFTPPSDTHVPATQKRWRPRIKPGAFWI